MDPATNGSSPAAGWERWPGESRQAFEAFRCYRDLPPSTRSVTRVSQELDKSRGLIGRWSSRWLWVSRVAEYDAMLDQKRRLENEEYIREMDERQRRIGRVLLNEVARYVNWLQTQNTMRNEGERPELPGNFVQLLQVAVNVERTAAGAVNYRESIEGGAKDRRPSAPIRLTEELMDATDDLLRAWEAAREQQDEDERRS